MDLNMQLENIFLKLDERLKILVNGRVPDVIKRELYEVLNGLGLTILPTTGQITPTDADNLDRIITAWVNTTPEENINVNVNVSQILYQLSLDGWIVIPPR